MDGARGGTQMRCTYGSLSMTNSFRKKSYTVWLSGLSSLLMFENRRMLNGMSGLCGVGGRACEGYLTPIETKSIPVKFVAFCLKSILYDVNSYFCNMRCLYMEL